MLQAMLQFISQERSHVPRPNPTRFSEHLLIVEGKVEEELRGQLKGDWRPCNIESFFADGQQRQALIDQEGQGEEAPGAQQTRHGFQSQEPKPLDSIINCKPLIK